MIKTTNFSCLIKTEFSFSKILFYIFKSILLTLVFLMGVNFFQYTIVTIFEHSQGFFDISTLELFFLISMAFMIKRNIFYWRNINIGFFTYWVKPFLLLGYTYTITLAFLASIFMTAEPLDLLDQNDITEARYLEYSYFLHFTMMIICIICFYLSVPFSYEKAKKDQNVFENPKDENIKPDEENKND